MKPAIIERGARQVAGAGSSIARSLIGGELTSINHAAAAAK